ncbi:ABC transporter ATP-binding protein [Rummeliibacillus sp. JY-2-4R]
MNGLQIKNVTKTYDEGYSKVTALNNASMEVKTGELVAIVGPSGSGKSTLLSIAGALLKPTSGSILINNREITSLSSKELSKFRLNEIGFILQTSNLIPYLKVIDQLILVTKMAGKPSKEGEEKAKKLLAELGLGGKFNKYPNELSGGERQRVAIARSFMNNSTIILADEPTASLDSKRAHEVVQLIADEVKKRNKAAIMVTHDERMLKYCDKVYKMEDGILTLI